MAQAQQNGHNAPDTHALGAHLHLHAYEKEAFMRTGSLKGHLSGDGPGVLSISVPDAVSEPMTRWTERGLRLLPAPDSSSSASFAERPGLAMVGNIPSCRSEREMRRSVLRFM